MKSPLEKEKHQKIVKKQKNVMLTITCVICSLAILRGWSILTLSPRYGVLEIVEYFFSAPFVFPPVVSYFAALAVSFLIFAASSLKDAEKELRKHDDPNTVQGDAHFMTQDELLKYQQTKTTSTLKDSNRKERIWLKYGASSPYSYHESEYDMIFSKEIALSIDNRKTRLNCNTLVIGGSGAGKSYSFVSPNLLQARHNFIVTDPSGELRRDYAKYLENEGYEILTFDITDIYRSNRYNPFHYIRAEKDILVMINTLIKNTSPKPESKAGDPFWENGEAMLLQSICLYLWHTAEPEEQTFENVLKMLSLAEIDENDATAKSPLDILFDKLEVRDPENLAVELYKKFKIGAGKTLKSFLISVNARLSKFALSEIKYLTGTDEFNFEEFAYSKKAIFVVTPTAENTFQFIVSQLYSQFFMAVYDYAETKASFGYMLKIGDDVLKVFPSDTAKGSKQAKKAAEQYLAYCKSDLGIRFNSQKQYYEVVIKKTKQVVTWRGTKRAAKEFIGSLSKATIEKCGSCCPRFIEMLLDEFANIGQIPDFPQKLATIRKYRIMVAIILQGLSQLESCYGDKWSEIVGNCDVKLILGTDDPKTNDFISKSLLGNKTVVIENKSINGKGEVSYSYNHSKQPLMEATQLRLLDTDYCIVCIRTQPPYYGKKYSTPNHPKYKEAIKTQGQFNCELSDAAQDYKAKHDGPLRLRKSQLVEKTASEAEGIDENTNAVEAVKEQEKPKLKKTVNEEKKERQKKNLQRLKNAEQEEEVSMADITASPDYVPPTEYSPEMEEAVFATFGIEPDASAEEIEEAIDNTLIPLEESPEEVIRYGITN